MKTLIKSVAVLGLLFSSIAMAHEGIEIESSVPADNAMLMESPSELAVSFSKEVRLIKVVLKNQQGDGVDFDFTPPKEAAAHFSWSLPKLSPAHYQVELIILGADGHKMKESFSFMVH